MYGTAELFAARLTEVEKLRLRAGTAGAREHLFETIHRYEIDAQNPRAVFDAAVELVQREHREKAARIEFGQTWKF